MKTSFLAIVAIIGSISLPAWADDECGKDPVVVPPAAEQSGPVEAKAEAGDTTVAAEASKASPKKGRAGCVIGAAGIVASKASWAVNALGLIGFGGLVATRVVGDIVANTAECD